MSDDSRTGDSTLNVDEPHDGSLRIPLRGRLLTKRAVFVAAIAVFGALLVVEQVGATPSIKSPAPRWSAFTPAKVNPAPPSNDNSTAAGSNGSSASVPTGAAALANAQSLVDAALARIQGATGASTGSTNGTSNAGSGTAAQGTTPRLAALGPRVCPILLEEGAELIAQTNRLIAKSPALATQLLQTLQKGLDRINTQLERFGCPISFG